MWHPASPFICWSFCLETSIREAFVRRQHLVRVSFDPEKAYDGSWRYGILRDLHECGLRGNLPLFIVGFLQNPRFWVRVGSVFLLPTGGGFTAEFCFVCHLIHSSHQGHLLLVSFDCACNWLCWQSSDFFCSCVNMRLLERQLQSVISRLSSWALRNSFVFSFQKIVCLFFP